MHQSNPDRVILCDIKISIDFWNNSQYVYLVAFCKLNLFNLDSTPARPGNPDYKPTETAINDNEKERVIKVIIGSAVSCMAALMLFLFTILYLKRRSNRLQQVVKDEVMPLR